MPSLFDGPKSVLNDIAKVMKQSQEQRANKFAEEARSKGYNTPEKARDYAYKALGDGNFARQVEAAARKKD